MLLLRLSFAASFVSSSFQVSTNINTCIFAGSVIGWNRCDLSVPFSTQHLFLGEFQQMDDLKLAMISPWAFPSSYNMDAWILFLHDGPTANLLRVLHTLNFDPCKLNESNLEYQNSSRCWYRSAKRIPEVASIVSRPEDLSVVIALHYFHFLDLPAGSTILLKLGSEYFSVVDYTLINHTHFFEDESLFITLDQVRLPSPPSLLYSICVLVHTSPSQVVLHGIEKSSHSPLSPHTFFLV